MAVYAILLVATPLVAGVDYRNGWSSPIPNTIKMIGIVILILSFVLLTWSMSVNRFFVATVRIQSARGHQVIDSGPY